MTEAAVVAHQLLDVALDPSVHSLSGWVPAGKRCWYCWYLPPEMSSCIGQLLVTTVGSLGLMSEALPGGALDAIVPG